MKLAIRTTPPLFAVLAALTSLPSISAAAPREFEGSGFALAQPTASSKVSSPSQAPRIELAGNRKRDNDDNFDPYGKDDPTNKKWGESAGLGGNRYGGLRTGGEGKGKNAAKNNDRDDREPRQPKSDDGGRN